MFAPPSGEPRNILRPRVAIATISPGALDQSYVESLLTIYAQKNEHTRPHYISLKRSGALIQMARNEVTAEIFNNLRDEIDWILWIDADIQFPADLIDKLYETHLDSQSLIVGGLYVHPMPERFKPSVFYYRTNANGAKYMDSLHQEDITSLRNQGQKWMYCDGTGAGCLMIHMDALKAMAERANLARDIEPWFTVRAINGTMYGEDLAFCHRAREMGMRIAVRIDLDLGHVKHVVYKPESPVVP